MKRLRQIFIAFTLFMAFAIYVFYSIGKKTSYEKRDIVYYNNLLYRVEAALEEGRDESEIEEEYGCSIVTAKEINNPELVKLYTEGALILDLEIDGKYIGKVAWNDFREGYNRGREAFFKAALILWSTILVCGYLLLFYIYLSFLKPVEALKDFASEIARGELDKSLPIPKNNMFGSFVEGFDLMREQLKSSISRERQAEIARKELIQGLSHDIKTPLSVIKATCELLEVKISRKLDNMKDSDPADINECNELLNKVESISKKADTISSLMSDVMHANLEELEKVDIEAQEESSLIIEEFLKNLSGYGKIILKNHIYPCLVMMDRRRMEQVIDNIIGNSYKYAGTDITVEFSQTEEIAMGDGSKAGFIKTTIRDAGPGVNKDDLPLIAEKYYRGSNSGEQNGFGLGMYLAKTYMDKQGGGMEYYNDNGFVVELLLRKI